MINYLTTRFYPGGYFHVAKEILFGKIINVFIKEGEKMGKKSLFAWMVILTSLAGVVNAISVFGYDGATVSHVTGLVSKFASSIANGNFKGGWEIFAIILSFLVGAITAGVATGERAFYLHRVYGIIIVAIGLLIIPAYFMDTRHSVFLFAYIMGLQNGMVVSFRGVVVRMTHMSGNLTDLGVFIGYKLRRNKNEKFITGFIPGMALLSFTIGGIIGILLFKAISNYVFFVVSGVYIILGIVYFFLQRTAKDKDFNGIPDDEE